MKKREAAWYVFCALVVVGSAWGEFATAEADGPVTETRYFTADGTLVIETCLGAEAECRAMHHDDYYPPPAPLVTPERIMDARWSGGYLIVSCEGGIVYRSNLAGGHWQGLARLGDVPPSPTHWRLFPGAEPFVGEVWGWDEHRVVRVYEGDR